MALAPWFNPVSVYPGMGGLAFHAGESAAHDQWAKHVVSMSFFQGVGTVIPLIGDYEPQVGHSVRALREWGTQYPTHQLTMSPIGEAIDWTAGGDVHAMTGYARCVPWNYRDSVADAPHTYLMVIRLPTTAGSLTYEYLYANNPRLTSAATWKGETVCFNSYSMTPQIWSGINTSSVINTGAFQVFTQDNTVVENQWHAIAISVHDWLTPDIRFAIDGEIYPPASVLVGGAAAAVPVYSATGPVRLGYEAGHTTQELHCALFQIFDPVLDDVEMCEHTRDPLRMFTPAKARSVGKTGAALKPVTLGTLMGMSEIVLANTTQ